MSTDDDFGRTELELAGSPNLPAPHDLVGMLRERLLDLVTTERAKRSGVFTREDTYAMQRGLASVIHGLTDYARAFQKVAQEGKGFVEDELIEAVGEQDGIPVSGLDVPDLDGTTIHIGRDTANAYTFDLDALFSAVAWLTLGSANLHMPPVEIRDEADRAAQELAEALHTAVIEALRTLVTLGKFEPQVTKVTAFTQSLSRLEGGDAIASTVTSSIRKKSVYKGVTVVRKQPK